MAEKPTDLMAALKQSLIDAGCEIPTRVTKITAKHPGECAECHGEARWKLVEEGQRPVKLCVWCIRPYRVET